MCCFTYPTLVTWTDPNGRVHIPPDPPLIDGHPPWYPRPNEYRRDEALDRCPALACRRAKRCVALLYGEFCQKTHMEREAFRWKIVQRFDEYFRKNNIPIVERQEGEEMRTPPPEVKRLLEERLEECCHEELLKFQQDWIEKQKRAFAQKRKTRINSGEKRP